MDGIRMAALTALAAVATSGTYVAAHGGFPATVDIRTHPTDLDFILVGTTFGLLVSRDGGDSFQWNCEAAIGYGGQFLPDYEIAPSGTIYATTFSGLRMSTDGGCTWEPVIGPPASAIIDDIEIGPDGRIWLGVTGDPVDNIVYVSNDGVSFAATSLSHPTAWWKKFKVAPSNADRIYTTASEFLGAELDGGNAPQIVLLYRSDDGGSTWESLPTTDFTFGPRPQLHIVGVSPINPDLVFAKVLQVDGITEDALYRSADAGATWTSVLSMPGTIAAFHIRPSGTVIAASQNICDDTEIDGSKGCVRTSTDDGLTWTAPPAEPRMACLAERFDGTLWACGSNWYPDDFAVGKSTDMAAWDKVMLLNDIEPASCSFSDDCGNGATWVEICTLFAICEKDGADAGPLRAELPEGQPRRGANGVSGAPGCGCRTGSEAGGLGLASLIALLCVRRTRRD